MKNRRENIGFLKAYRSSFESKYANSAQVALVVKNPPVNAGDIREAGSIPRFGRSPGGGTGQQPTPVSLPGEFPWTKESGRLQSIGSHKVRHN